MAMERAPRVCTTCKVRKKGCDKALPICGYCSQRGLLCSYEYSASSSLAGAHFSTSFLPNLTPSSASDATFSGLESSIHLDISTLFHNLDRSFSVVCDRYFGGFHLWLPVVSQDLLLQTIATYSDGFPPPDLSLLVLALHLVTLNPSHTSGSSQISPQKLYVELRILLTKVQIILPPSKYIAQAILLVAAYEYACGRPHDSYLSVGTCARMLSVLGLDKLDSRDDYISAGPIVDVRTLESRNIYWGVIVLDRLVANECPSDHLKPAVNIPSLNTELPSDLIPKDFAHSNSPHNGRDRGHGCAPSVGDLESLEVMSFGRQVQAVFFLDEVLDATSEDNQVPIPTILKLDEKLWNFLGILMSQTPQRHHCGANGTIVRSLIRLHQHVLKQSFHPGTADAKMQEKSHAALDTLSRMMVEVAHDHLERFVPGDIDSLPLTCSYNMRSIMELIKDRWRNFSDHDLFCGLEACASLNQAASRRWESSLDN